MDDEKRITWQLELIRLVYRAEARRLNEDGLQVVRERGFRLLDQLEDGADADLQQRIAAVRQELGG